MSDFERAYEFTRRAEGGYVWNKNDPGGETNFGVTKSVWWAWCQAKGLPFKAMQSLTQEDVMPLYRERYWQPLAATLPWPLSAAIFDMSVNHGVGDGKPDDESGDEAGATYLLWRAKQLVPSGTALETALAACEARKEFYLAIIARKPLPGCLQERLAQPGG